MGVRKVHTQGIHVWHDGNKEADKSSAKRSSEAGPPVPGDTPALRRQTAPTEKRTSENPSALDFTKIPTLVLQNALLRERQATDWEEISAHHISDKGFIPTTYIYDK